MSFTYGKATEEAGKDTMMDSGANLTQERDRGIILIMWTVRCSEGTQ